MYQSDAVWASLLYKRDTHKVAKLLWQRQTGPSYRIENVVKRNSFYNRVFSFCVSYTHFYIHRRLVEAGKRIFCHWQTFRHFIHSIVHHSTTALLRPMIYFLRLLIFFLGPIIWEANTRVSHINATLFCTCYNLIRRFLITVFFLFWIFLLYGKCERNAIVNFNFIKDFLLLLWYFLYVYVILSCSEEKKENR